MPLTERTHFGKFVILALIWACPGKLWAQTLDISLQVTDLSGPDSPINASGNVVFHEILSAETVQERHDLDLHLTNISSKTILAYEVSVEAMPDYGGGFNLVNHTDHFFLRQLLFVPGTEEDMDFTSPGWATAPRGRGGPNPTSASFKVLFVEFADGSKFGSSHWGASLSKARQLAAQHMRDIGVAYEMSGEQGLRSTLETALLRQDDPQTTLSVMTRLKATLDSGGASSAAAQINDFLAVGDKRKDIM